ncbi:transporter [Candidatus Odyssella acanthamoebae]|uniref:transporter n=1 Tax=Candidatus Odyssella acanthamoebae TaxID=91604 RepID=UPI00068C5544|nr:transporter [Candidatus Paracaedibacter acanthamoebae]
MHSLISYLCTISFLLTSAFAENKSYDKSKHHIFYPTPVKNLRELSTDRPDKTEGPFTVDAGHYQIEFDMATYTYDRNKRDHTRTYGYTIFAPNFRVGLYDNLEVNLIMTSFKSVKTKDIEAGQAVRNQGFDDMLLRFKYNFWGNEGKDRTAFGLIPFVKLPTNHDHLGNKSYDGGVILPLDIKITDKLGLGVMTEVDYQKGDSVKRHVFNFVNSASLGYDFTDKTSGFLEIFTEKSRERGSKWNVTLDFGMTYGVTDNLQLDAGAYVGLSKLADNITPFVGMTCRF